MIAVPAPKSQRRRAWLLPSRDLILGACGCACALAALGASGVADDAMLPAAILVGAAALALIGADVLITRARWRGAPLALVRHLPHAFAVGVPVSLEVSLENAGEFRRRGKLFESADPTLDMPEMPLSFDLGPRRRETFRFRMTPLTRGTKRFDPAQIRLRSTLGLFDWSLDLGATESRRVFPNFRAHARFGWLTSNQRLAEMGIKAIRRRGSATDFDELIDYQPGDSIRHVDWKATLKHQKPIVRKFQDERDQAVIFLLDCGRRMRADDTQQGIGATHFDQALNALMLLAFVALGKGDAVGAMTFGAPEGSAKHFALRKGRRSLDTLMAELTDVEPTPIFSDYVRAAADCIRRHRKRGLLVLITNCRDEDSTELTLALKLLRSRHLVVLANLREQIVGKMAGQRLDNDAAPLEAAAALEYEHRRRDMLERLRLGGVLTIDCEPEQLGVELINRYTALKRAGSL